MTLTDETTVAEPTESWSWARAVYDALEQRPCDRAILAMLALTDGQPEREVPVELIAALLGVQTSTVRSMLPDLETRGWVRRVPGLSPAGRPTLEFVTTRTVR